MPGPTPPPAAEHAAAMSSTTEDYADISTLVDYEDLPALGDIPSLVPTTAAHQITTSGAASAPSAQNNTDVPTTLDLPSSDPANEALLSALLDYTFTSVSPEILAFLMSLLTVDSNGDTVLPPVEALSAEMQSQLYELLGSLNRRESGVPGFNAVAFVDGLEQVAIADIPAEDMRCPHCWLPFGITDEDDPVFAFAPDPDDSPELVARQVAFRGLPFCAARADNDPVRTPCGHLFGRTCLIQSLEKVSTLCPTCRQELNSNAEKSEESVVEDNEDQSESEYEYNLEDDVDDLIAEYAGELYFEGPGGE
jgi:hypothetical protein